MTSGIMCADEDVNAADRLIELIFDVFEELARFASFRVASFDPKGVQLAIQQAPVAFVDIPLLFTHMTSLYTAQPSDRNLTSIFAFIASRLVVHLNNEENYRVQLRTELCAQAPQLLHLQRKLDLTRI